MVEAQATSSSWTAILLPTDSPRKERNTKFIPVSSTKPSHAIRSGNSSFVTSGSFCRTWCSKRVPCYSRSLQKRRCGVFGISNYEHEVATTRCFSLAAGIAGPSQAFYSLPTAGRRMIYALHRICPVEYKAIARIRRVAQCWPYKTAVREKPLLQMRALLVVSSVGRSRLPEGLDCCRHE